MAGIGGLYMRLIRNRRFPRFEVAGLAFALIVIIVMPLAAQQAISTGTITGVVRDAQGLPMPGVTIECVNEQTRASRTAVSSSSGDFNITALLPSRYTVKAVL